ncbi:GYD domain-containing protein [Halosimplex amylolyticum]|uniref:GYD domain-containing protein n=1 Tax=Halosimplex amylolyticum TaxID=3396616 RepID=UPI003F54CC49
MPTYITHVDVNEGQFQNPQEFVSIWGAIREDIQELGGDVEETYAILGDYDFHVRFTVESSETAFQVTQVIERHGLDTKTMEALPLDRVGELVEDI